MVYNPIMRLPLDNWGSFRTGFKFGAIYPARFGNLAGQRHLGIDKITPEGTPVRASEDGPCVINTNPNRETGLMVEVRGTRRWHRNMHLSRIMVNNGQFVREGDIVGYTGNTGVSDTAHIHYDRRYPGSTIEYKNFTDPEQDNSPQQQEDEMTFEEEVSDTVNMFAHQWKLYNGKDPDKASILKEAIDAVNRRRAGETYAKNFYLDKYYNERPKGNEVATFKQKLTSFISNY